MSPISALPDPYYDDGTVRIYHGDCREALAWLKGDVLVTDPPYGLALRSGRGGAFGESEIAGDESADLRDEVLRLWGSKPALVFGSWQVERPPGVRHLLVWDKGEHVGMGDLSMPWKPNTEEVYVLGSGFQGRRDGSVLRHLAIAGTVGQAGMGNRWHPTQKPVDLMRELIAKCPPGVIVDPFMGSGTTLRAAKDLGRPAIGVEVRREYCEVAARRLGQEVLAV